MKVAALLFLACSLALSQGQKPSRGGVLTVPDERKAKMPGLNPDFLLLTPSLKDSKEKLPLVIYLHGAGGVGEDINKLQGQGGRVLGAMKKHVENPVLMVAPQVLPAGRKSEAGPWDPAGLNVFLDHLKSTLPVDPDRIYLTGNSMGGYGTWVWAGTYPKHFAAVAPMVGGIGKGGPKDVTPDLDKWVEKLMEVPVWAFAGANDKVVPAEHSERIIKAVVAKGHKEAKMTVYPEEGHGAGGKAYADPKFWEWLFSHRRETAE